MLICAHFCPIHTPSTSAEDVYCPGSGLLSACSACSRRLDYEQRKRLFFVILLAPLKGENELAAGLILLQKLDQRGEHIFHLLVLG